MEVIINLKNNNSSITYVTDNENEHHAKLVGAMLLNIGHKIDNLTNEEADAKFIIDKK